MKFFENYLIADEKELPKKGETEEQRAKHIDWNNFNYPFSLNLFYFDKERAPEDRRGFISVG